MEGGEAAVEAAEGGVVGAGDGGGREVGGDDERPAAFGAGFNELVGELEGIGGHAFGAEIVDHEQPARLRPFRQVRVPASVGVAQGGVHGRDVVHIHPLAFVDQGVGDGGRGVGLARAHRPVEQQADVVFEHLLPAGDVIYGKNEGGVGRREGHMPVFFEGERLLPPLVGGFSARFGAVPLPFGLPAGADHGRIEGAFCVRDGDDAFARGMAFPAVKQSVPEIVAFPGGVEFPAVPGGRVHAAFGRHFHRSVRSVQ